MYKETDLAYIAGLMDGEAHIGVKRSKAYACQSRQTPGYHPRIGIRMVDEAAIRFIAETLGGWYYKEKRAAPNRRILYAYQATDREAVRIIRTLLPYFRVKREIADTVLALQALRDTGAQYRTKITGYRNFPNAKGTPRQVPNLSYSDEYVAMCESFYQRCKALNHGTL